MTTTPQEANDLIKESPKFEVWDKFNKTPKYQFASQAESFRRKTYQVGNSHLKKICEAPDEDLSSKHVEEAASNFSKNKSIGISTKKLSSEKAQNTQFPLENQEEIDSKSKSSNLEEEWVDYDEDLSKAKGETQVLPKCTPIMSKINDRPDEQEDRKFSLSQPYENYTKPRMIRPVDSIKLIKQKSSVYNTLKHHDPLK